MSILKAALVSSFVGASLVLPVNAALAADEDVSVGSCPDGYRGVVIGVTTSATGSKEVRLCYKSPPPADNEP